MREIFEVYLKIYLTMRYILRYMRYVSRRNTDNFFQDFLFIFRNPSPIFFVGEVKYERVEKQC